MPVVIEETTVKVAIKEEVVKVVVSSQPVITRVVGIQGPKGPKGDTAVSNSVRKIAGENLGGNRVVVINTDGKAYYADNTNLDHKHKVLGITEGAIENNAEGDIQTYGVMTEPSWNWDMTKAIYLNANGLLTQNVPSSGFVLQMGFPLSATSMFIDIKQPIILV